MADTEPLQPHYLVAPVSRRSVEDEDWSSLPGDILEQVLPLLSFPEVYRLRSVCKRWNDLIRAQFQERALRSGLPWGPFYLERVWWECPGLLAVPWFAYDLSENTAREITMPQLEFPECVGSARWDLIASGGGLLCFGAHGFQRRILVCNPMTKAWRELPDVRCFYSSAWLMVPHVVVDVECGGSYKIFFADPKRVDVYDSASNKWSAVEPPSSELRFESIACRNSEVYLLGKLGRGPYMVVILDVATLRWREDTISMPTIFVKDPFIVACYGEVYLVHGIYGIIDTKPTLKSILLFRLDPDGRWTKVSEYANHGYIMYGCGVHHGQIFVVTRDWVVAYNCATGVWEELVIKDLFIKRDIYGTKFAFQPNLLVAP